MLSLGTRWDEREGRPPLGLHGTFMAVMVLPLNRHGSQDMIICCNAHARFRTSVQRAVDKPT